LVLTKPTSFNIFIARVVIHMYSAVKVIVTVKVQYDRPCDRRYTDAADEKFTRLAIKISECMAT
jgi:hypothetical protein